MTRSKLRAFKCRQGVHRLRWLNCRDCGAQATSDEQLEQEAAFWRGRLRHADGTWPSLEEALAVTAHVRYCQLPDRRLGPDFPVRVYTLPPISTLKVGDTITVTAGQHTINVWPSPHETIRAVD
jgi:hypothetical protein